ncbi:hypothetical protein ASE01_03460 [Nocardioides sp. Root190]|nr:hypothetical protein ASE01_03460 [Nocardioides sp. Root190]
MAAIALVVSGCAASTGPAADPDPATSGSPSASASATSSERPEDLSRSGARADVPDIEIMAQLARRAERIAKNLPQAPIPADVDRGSNRALGYQLMIEFGLPANQ